MIRQVDSDDADWLQRCVGMQVAYNMDRGHQDRLGMMVFMDDMKCFDLLQEDAQIRNKWRRKMKVATC